MENNKKKLKYLIVDTTGFIKNVQFQDVADNVITTPSVTKEITSRSQLRRLAVLPYDLTVKEPFTENIAHVSEFSKKTGDYASLSATDIQVIALTYQLEKEYCGDAHLRSEPLKRVIAPGSLPSQEFKNIAGFYKPQGKDEAESTEEECTVNPDSKATENLELRLEGLEISLDKNAEDKAEQANSDEELENSGTEDDDDDGWITPGNIADMKRKIISEVDEEASPVVGCITTDFAMQNVLKQMGLNVIALDGRVIKEIRTFILRCYACFKTTSVMSKVFCPNCGNKTLKKVAVSTNPDGTQQIHINYMKPLTSRGKRFSLPTPKGGKHANNPILCEDQPMPQQRGTLLSRAKNNPLDDDYITGFSPFVTRDVNSRSALLGIHTNSQLKQWMRKNPNESNKPGGRKRK